MTRRGLVGQIERGYHAGGLCLGYRSVVVGFDKHGNPIGHRLEQKPTQAEWVRWIFSRYVEGSTTRRISYELNALGVRSARGGTWGASAIYGRADRGAGVLNNKLYIGHYIWNRSHWGKDPDTGKRQRVDHKRDDWMVDKRPKLRIVDDELWQAAQERIATPRALGGSVGPGPRPKTLFSGMLRCGYCGGAVSAVSAVRYGCSTRKERGPTVCAGVLVSRTDLDARMLPLLRDELLAPAAVAEIQRQVRDGFRKVTESKPQDRARLVDSEAEIGRLVDAIAKIGLSEALGSRLRAAERTRDELRSSDEPAPCRAIPTPEAIAVACRRMVMNARECLDGDISGARTALQSMLGEIRLVAEGDEVYAEVETRSDRLLLKAVGAGVSNSGCGDRI